MEEIKIRGARIHNLKNINLTIPKGGLVVITGISGSGKSSLAFDILFEEGVRLIVLLSNPSKPDRSTREIVSFRPISTIAWHCAKLIPQQDASLFSRIPKSLTSIRINSRNIPLP